MRSTEHELERMEAAVKEMAQELRQVKIELRRKGRVSERLHDMCNAFPLERVHYDVESDRVIAAPYASNVWVSILRMAKEMHTQKAFIQRNPEHQKRDHYNPIFYDDKKVGPRLLADFTTEQMMQSAELAEDLARVYNDHLLRNYPFACVKHWGDDEYTLVPIIDSQRMEDS